MKFLIPKCRSLYFYRDEDIVYSPNKYRETEGSKDIGSNFWNAGRTQEIKERVLHVDDMPVEDGD